MVAVWWTKSGCLADLRLWELSIAASVYQFIAILQRLFATIQENYKPKNQAGNEATGSFPA